MPSNTTESPGKQRRQPVNGLRRDQPLFGSRRTARSLQQPPDFLTDSLNTSYIPSPSPPKSPTRQDTRAKPRQALSNGQLTPGTLKTTARISDENKRPSAPPSSSRRGSQQSHKPLPVQSQPRASITPSSKPARTPARTQTPSPPRGRQTSITSPVASESSPGRGYAEAYQRIVEEENLAQEDSLQDMEDIDGYDFNEQERTRDLDRIRLQRIQHSASPISLKASRRASPRAAVEDSPPARDAANSKQDLTHDSGSESGVDYTGTVTNTSIDSGSSQYAKDLQRLGALKEGAKVFSKARVGDKAGLTVENLQRRNGSNESLGSAFSGASFSNRGSDPSVNIPKAWGRKAKPGKDWLSRINSTSGKLTGDVPSRRSSGDSIATESQNREWAEPIDDWIVTAAEVPLPSGEEGSSQATLSSRGSTPTLALERSSSRDQRRQWGYNDEDFTGRSLQVSDSPPIRIRNGTVDRFREREIENLEKRAVTTNRLGELREKSSDELLRRRPSSRSAEETGNTEDTDEREVPWRRQSSGRSSLRSELRDSDQTNTPDATAVDTGEAIPDTPVVIYRSRSHEQSDAYEQNRKDSEITTQASHRPDHERKDSRDLLRRLSKVTSDSPSLMKEQKEEALTDENKVKVEQTPQSSKISTDRKTPVVTGAWVDETFENIPQPSKLNANLKTPLVTGAWVDTPLPTGGRGPPMPTPSDEEDAKELGTGKLGATELIRRLSPTAITERAKSQDQVRLKYSGPPLAKSALEEIVKNAKFPNPQKAITTSTNSDSEEDPTIHLGDSTIQSLEELIANDTDFSTLLAPSPISPDDNSGPSSDPSPSSQALTSTSTTSTSAKSSRLADLQSYTHLLSRIANLAPSIRASKKQIASLERAVSSPAPTSAQSLANLDNDTCNEAGEFHDFIWPCARCGCPGRPEFHPFTSFYSLRDSFTTIALPIPRLWVWRDVDWRPRLTWLGVIITLAWTFVYAEMWARALFCHPLYATRMVGYGVDINAPRPPFVLVKVIYRYTALGTVAAPFYYVAKIAVKLFASLFGYIVGFALGNESGGSPLEKQQPLSRDTRIPKPAFGGPDLSLMDDEYL